MFTILAMLLAAFATTAAAARPRQAASGQLIIGAEQEPDCMDWIGSCSGSSWGYWMAQVGTMPRTYDTVKTKSGWTWKRNSLLASEPTLVTSPAQKVTYTINPKAVWSDGQPITSTDFKYTWDQVANGSDVYDQTGYKEVASVDDSDPHVAVVTFKNRFGAWKQLFSGNYGVWPSHLLQGKDRDALTKDGYTWSGGPWKIESWKKGDSITLVPNTAFWGTKPRIGKIIFKFVADSSAEFQAYKGGEVSMIYPQPQPDVVDAIKAGGIPGNKVFTSDTGSVEAFWINNSVAPFDNANVRRALAFSINRVALVKRLFGPLGVKQPQNSMNPPILSAYANPAFKRYSLNLKKASVLMLAAGYRKSGGVWAKGGKPVEFTLKTTVGNARRKLTTEIVAAQLKAAGFKANLVYVKAGDLFGQQLPAGDFTIALYAQVNTIPEPSLCTIFCSANIPGPANDNSGQNWTHTDVRGLDTPLGVVDASLNNNLRIKSSKAADGLIAASVTTLPLDPLPNILFWSTKLSGSIGDNPVLGPFWNANTWTLKS
ncbi:MAG: ABC transporter substrate-binding protein [Acidimicrobiia bacterium]